MTKILTKTTTRPTRHLPNRELQKHNHAEKKPRQNRGQDIKVRTNDEPPSKPVHPNPYPKILTNPLHTPALESHESLPT